MHIVELDRRAVEASVEVVRAIPEDRWRAATPCSAWRLDELVAHMTAQHRGFAASSRGDADPSVWAEPALGPNPRDEYADAARAVLDAFAEDGVVDRQFAPPPFLPLPAFPGAQAVGFHFVDYVVHAWDVAASIGVPVTLDDDVVVAALEIIEREVPVGPQREEPGAPFAPPVALDPGASAFDRVLALVGRSPRWPAS